MRDQLKSLIAQMHDSGILFSEAEREFKKQFILHVLAEKRGNQVKAAEALGIHRNTLSRAIKDLKIDSRRCSRGQQRYPVRSALRMSAEQTGASA